MKADGRLASTIQSDLISALPTKMSVAPDDAIAKSIRGRTTLSICAENRRAQNAPRKTPGLIQRERSNCPNENFPTAASPARETTVLNNRKRASVARISAGRRLPDITATSGGPLTEVVVPQKPHRNPATNTFVMLRPMSTRKRVIAETPTSTHAVNNTNCGALTAL